MVDDSDIIGVFGYIYVDYYSKNGLSLEWIINNSDKHPFAEGAHLKAAKVTINPEYTDSFLDYLRGNDFIKARGGGGGNSGMAFKCLRQPIIYIDTSRNPPDAYVPWMSCFGQMCHPCVSLIIKRFENSEDNDSVALKTMRGDTNGIPLPDDFVEEIEGFLAGGHDAFVNSISNSSLAELIAKNAKGSVYVLATPHFDLKKQGFKDLLARSDGVHFSLREFLYMGGKSEKWENRLESSLKEGDFQEIVGEVGEFVRQYNIKGYVVVTHGGQGALVHPNNGRDNSFWVVLGPAQRNKVNEHIKSKSISPNRSGDYHEAAFDYVMRKGGNIRDAALFANSFVIQNVLQYNKDEPFNNSDFDVIELEKSI